MFEDRSKMKLPGFGPPWRIGLVGDKGKSPLDYSPSAEYQVNGKPNLQHMSHISSNPRPHTSLSPQLSVDG